MFHTSETVQYAAGDPALEGLVGQTKQVLQIAEEALNNTMKALEKIQRDQAIAAQEDGGEQPAGEQPDGPSEVDLKMQKAQVEMQISQQKAELDMALKQRKFDQEQTMRDAKAALEFREEQV